MDDLIAKIRAAIDQDERLARYSGGTGNWTARSARHGGTGNEWDVVEGNYPVAMVRGSTRVQHIARHDPARVLRQVAAHRKILDSYIQARDYRAEVDAADPRSFEDADVRDTTIAGAYAAEEALKSAILALAEGYGIETPPR